MMKKTYDSGTEKAGMILELENNWTDYSYPEARLFEILGEEDIIDAEEAADMDVLDVDFDLVNNKVTVFYE